MEEINQYFFDTYALIEVIVGNPNYLSFTKNVIVVTSKLNLLELHYSLLKSYGANIADQELEKLRHFVIDFSLETIKSASKFKKVMAKRKLAYADCLGYSLALELNIPFLTGDKEFEDLPNVEFVK